MKRCPECDFLYYDEQDHCDIDGTRLRFTTKLPTPEATQTKSLRVTFTIVALATIILGSVLFILYPPHWHASTSSPAAEVRPVKVPDANTDAQLPPSKASPHTTSTPSPKPAADSRDPFAPMEPKTEKTDSSLGPNKPKLTIMAPASRSMEPKPAMNQPPTVTQGAPVNPKPTTSSYSMSAPSVRPVAGPTATPKPVTQNSNKDSKLNSMVKKAGRFLKKPF